MRWDDLFADLEAQADAAEATDLAAEVADRTRRERALLRLTDRVRPLIGAEVSLALAGTGTVHGRLLDVGPDWLLLEESGRRELLASTAALLSLSGAGPHSDAPGSEGELAQRLDLRWALRSLARGRAGVGVVLRDGTVLTGTIDGVGADHLDLAEHPAGEPRRPGAVRGVRLVPLAAVSAVRSTG